mmetsp:Transcript_9778/g.14898  ORF Transcript_9778/g.14898 Transcript_9778/m.14898 type:complete len:458 (+) Transcript_9778:26-1399(+)
MAQPLLKKRRLDEASIQDARKTIKVFNDIRATLSSLDNETVKQQRQQLNLLRAENATLKQQVSERDALNQQMEELQTESQLLREENATLKQQVNESDARNQQLKQELQTERQQRVIKQEAHDVHLSRSDVELSKLKLVLRGVVCVAKQGGAPPHYQAVAMEKMHKMSQRVAAIKKEWQTYAARMAHLVSHLQLEKRNPNSNQCHNFAWIEENALLNRMGMYIEANKDRQEIVVLMERNAGSQTQERKQIQLQLQRQDCIETSQAELVEVYNIVAPFRVKALEGQQGVRAKQAIPIGTVIGEYTGTVYTEQEFKEVFDETNEANIRNVYAFDLMVGQDRLVIDGYNDKKHNPLICINDCRMNIDDELPSNSDEEKWNTEFRTCYIDGFPRVFVVCCKNIQAKQPLSIFYGNDYGIVVRNLKQQDLARAKISALIDDDILQILGYDQGRQGVPEMYILE